MEIEGKEYNLKCECGEKVIKRHPSYEDSIALDCPKCGEGYWAYPEEAELFETIPLSCG